MKEYYDVDSGARPLKRAVENLIQDPIAENIISGKFSYGDTVKISIKNNTVVYQNLRSKKKKKAK